MIHCIFKSTHHPFFKLIFLFFLFFHNCSAQTSATPSPDSVNHFVIRRIVLIGNKRTKDRILFRELIFHVGDTLDEIDLERRINRSQENLLNTLLFNTVNIQQVKDEQGLIDIYIFVAERWYIFPAPIFQLGDRNFNEWLKNGDYSRVTYGGYLYWNNFRGRNETVVLGVELGYTQQIAISYDIPYINSNQKSGLAVSYTYNRNHEIGYQTFDNHLDFLKLNEDLYAKREWQAGIQYSHRQAIYNTYYVAANENFASVNDTVIKLNPYYLAGGKTTERFATFRFLFKHDQRDNINYPLVGNYFDFEAMKVGFQPLNDDIDFFYFTSQYKKFWKLWKGFYFASGIRGKLSGHDFQPYYNIKALGYSSDYLRGYEYYVIDGQKFVLLKTDFKYELIPTHYIKANVIPSEKFSTIPYAFYVNLYADYGYVQNNQSNQYYFSNTLANSNLYSCGGGIDFATYYNFVLRVEYSINKFGEKGIFIHFTAPI